MHIEEPRDSNQVVGRGSQDKGAAVEVELGTCGPASLCKCRGVMGCDELSPPPARERGPPPLAIYVASSRCCEAGVLFWVS